MVDEICEYIPNLHGNHTLYYFMNDCRIISSLLNSHSATMQRCIDNAHRKGQFSSTLEIPQLRQLKPFREQMAMVCIQRMEKWEVYWTDCFFMPQDLVEIQVEQSRKEDNY